MIHGLPENVNITATIIVKAMKKFLLLLLPFLDEGLFPNVWKSHCKSIIQTNPVTKANSKHKSLKICFIVKAHWRWIPTWTEHWNLCKSTYFFYFWWHLRWDELICFKLWLSVLSSRPWIKYVDFDWLIGEFYFSNKSKVCKNEKQTTSISTKK